MHTVLLPVGDELYAVPIEWVSEVVAAPVVTWLPTAPAQLLGLINLRGEIVPLFDTAALLGVGTAGSVEFAAVLRTVHGPAAFAATGFPQRAELASAIGPSERPGTTGTYEVDHKVAVLLDPAILLGPEQSAANDLPAVFPADRPS